MKFNKLNSKRCKLLVLTGLILFALVILSVNGSALGITPPRTSVNFSPGLHKTVSFTVVNSEHKNISLALYVKGELGGDIYLPVNSVNVSADENNVRLNYSFILPSTLSPGPHTGEVVILEVPPGSEASEAFIGATVGVTSQLYVMVPYPGKYAEASINIVNPAQGGNATFIFPVANKGLVNLENVYANVDIYNSLGTKVASFNTPSISVDKGNRRQIVYDWKSDVPIGKYEAKATLIYDGKTIDLEKDFTVGQETLDLQRVSVNNFKLGEIAKINMLVDNQWSEPIQNVYAETKVYDSSGGQVADIKSRNYNIDPQQKTIMSSYWDTSGLEEGTYKADVYLKYGSKVEEHEVTLNVKENSVEIEGLGFIPTPEINDKGNLTIVLVSIIAFLIILNLSWFLFLRKKFKNFKH